MADSVKITLNFNLNLFWLEPSWIILREDPSKPYQSESWHTYLQCFIKSELVKKKANQKLNARMTESVCYVMPQLFSVLRSRVGRKV